VANKGVTGYGEWKSAQESEYKGDAATGFSSPGRKCGRHEPAGGRKCDARNFRSANTIEYSTGGISWLSVMQGMVEIEG